MISNYLTYLMEPYFKLKNQAVENFFKEFNQEHKTDFNCIFFMGRGYTSAKPGDRYKYVTSEFAECINGFQSVYEMENDAFHIQRKLNKYLGKIDRKQSVEFCIPIEWQYNSNCVNKDLVDPEGYKKILTEKEAKEFEELMQQCLMMRMVS